MTHRAGCSAGIVALGYIGISPRAGAAEWVFGIENHANDAIVEFRTQDNDGWSVNHVGHPVDVGAERVISFGKDRGPATIRTQICFADDTFIETAVNYLKLGKLEIFKNEVKAA